MEKDARRKMELQEHCMNCKTWEEDMYWSHFMPVHFCLVLGAAGDYRPSIALPQTFSENMKNRVPDKVTLQGPSGATFEVKLSRSMSTYNTLSLTDGWEEFVNSYSLKENDILVFKYSGTSHIPVLTFRGDTHCEKESAYFFRKCGHESQEKRNRRVPGLTSSVERNTDHDVDDERVRGSVPAAAEDAACQTPSAMHGGELRCYGRKRKKHSAGKSLLVKAKSAKTNKLNNPSYGHLIEDMGLTQSIATAKKSPAKEVCSGKGRRRPRKQLAPITEMENLTNQSDPSNNDCSLDAQQHVNQEEDGNCQVETSPEFALASSKVTSSRVCSKTYVGSNPSAAAAKKTPSSKADSAELDHSTNDDKGSDSEETLQNINHEEDRNRPLESSPPIIVSSSKTVSSRGRPIKYVGFNRSTAAAKKSPATDVSSGKERGGPQKQSTPMNKEISVALEMAYKEVDALSFVRVMNPSAVERRFLMTIPNDWFRKNVPRSNQQVTLIVGEKKWIAPLSYSPNSITGTLYSHGWKQFAFENQLEVNDVCLFKLTSQSGEPLEFNVRIFRAASVASSSPVMTSSPL